VWHNLQINRQDKAISFNTSCIVQPLNLDHYALDDMASFSSRLIKIASIFYSTSAYGTKFYTSFSKLLLSEVLLRLLQDITA